jgi:hypothetical protein
MITVHIWVQGGLVQEVNVVDPNGLDLDFNYQVHVVGGCDATEVDEDEVA